MNEGLFAVNFGNAIRTKWRYIALSQVSDSHLIDRLRDMEKLVPDAEDLEIGYVGRIEDVPDPESLNDYEVLKLAAETRGLTWRVVS